MLLAKYWIYDSVFWKKIYICRGNLTLWSSNKYHNNKYYHSWIEFEYTNRSYIFDPSFNLLCLKDLYEKVFAGEIFCKISGDFVKEELIKYLSDSQKYYTLIKGTNNVRDPFYRTDSSVTGLVIKNKILSLNVRYYLNG